MGTALTGSISSFYIAKALIGLLKTQLRPCCARPAVWSLHGTCLLRDVDQVREEVRGQQVADGARVAQELPQARQGRAELGGPGSNRAEKCHIISTSCLNSANCKSRIAIHCLKNVNVYWRLFSSNYPTLNQREFSSLKWTNKQLSRNFSIAFFS